MEQVVRGLLVDCRAWLQEELENNVENYSSCPGSTFKKMRRSLSAEGREIVEPIEAMIARLDEALADNAAGGI